MKKNYMFCVDIKTMLQHDALPGIGKCYRGTLTMANDYLCRFVETLPAKPVRRNPSVYAVAVAREIKQALEAL